MQQVWIVCLVCIRCNWYAADVRSYIYATLHHVRFIYYCIIAACYFISNICISGSDANNAYIHTMLPMSAIVTCLGSYANNVYIYVENMKGSALSIDPLEFGVSCVKWSPCGYYLFIGGRKHDDIICWDVRTNLAEVGRFKRKLNSNQKMSFDLTADGKYLLTGSQDGE